MRACRKRPQSPLKRSSTGYSEALPDHIEKKNEFALKISKKRLPSGMQGQEVCELEMANFTYKFLKIRGEIRADACNSNVMVLATK